MKRLFNILFLLLSLLSACRPANNTPVAENTASVPPLITSTNISSPSTPITTTATPETASIISAAQERLPKQLAYIPPPPITPIPTSTQTIYGHTYLVYHTEPDPFRLICPQEGCGLDERLIYAIYAGTKVRLQKLIRIAGVDVVDELKPVDIHLVTDAECTRASGEWGSSGGYTSNPNKVLICLYLDQVGTFKESGAFGPIQVDPANPLTPETVIRLGGAGVIGHEYAHLLFFNRHQYSTEEYVNALDNAATVGVINPGYLDLCSPYNETYAGPLHQLCIQYGFTLSDFRTALIELDRLYRAGYGRLNGMTDMNQMRAVIQSLIGQDPLKIFQEAGYYQPGTSVAPYQLPFANEPCTNRAEIVEDVTAPDGTMFDVNTPFEKTWRIKNTGTCSWEGYSLTFIGQEQMSGPNAIPVPVTAAGTTVNLTVSLKAPATPGVHVGHWRLRAANGKFFGPIINTTIYTRAGCSSAPEISFFKVTPNTMGKGALALLEWGQVTNVDQVTISPQIGTVDVNGGRILVQPKETTTFTLIASCGDKTSQQEVTLTIDPNLPPFAITSLTAQASPDEYTGPCVDAQGAPLRVDFGATIIANSPGVILYQWERSDLSIPRPFVSIVDASKPHLATTYWMTSASVVMSQRFVILAPSGIPPVEAKAVISCTP